MARALGEYEVRGIKTSIPFFRWLLAEEDFRHGRFDTTYLDRELARRAGEPFITVPEEAEHVALLAAAIHAYEGATPRGSAGDAGSGRGSQAGALQGAPVEGLRMNFDIEVNGASARGRVERVGRRFRIESDGRVDAVDVARDGSHDGVDDSRGRSRHQPRGERAERPRARRRREFTCAQASCTPASPRPASAPAGRPAPGGRAGRRRSG